MSNITYEIMFSLKSNRISVIRIGKVQHFVEQNSKYDQRNSNVKQIANFKKRSNKTTTITRTTVTRTTRITDTHVHTETTKPYPTQMRRC